MGHAGGVCVCERGMKKEEASPRRTPGTRASRRQLGLTARGEAVVFPSGERENGVHGVPAGS